MPQVCKLGVSSFLDKFWHEQFYLCQVVHQMYWISNLSIKTSEIKDMEKYEG